MKPPFLEDQAEIELALLQEKNSKSKSNSFLNHLRKNGGIYFLIFIVLLFFVISLGMFYFQVESFEDNKFKRLKINHSSYSSK